MNRRLFATIALSAVTSAALTGIVIHTVRALDIPATNPLYYRGTLEEGPARFTGTRAFRIRLLQESGGAEACRTDALDVRVTNGAFEVPLSSACANAVRNHRDLLVAVEVGETMASLEQVGDPVQLGAVPYAIEAERAVRASQADPDGGLATQLQQLQARIDALQTQLAAPDCPPGWDPVTSGVVGFDMAGGNLRRLCRKMLTTPGGGMDEIVRVGTPPSVFWIDRYEASVIRVSNGARQFESDTPPAALPRSGQWNVESGVPTPLVPQFAALSVASVMPARWVTWFQAAELCRVSGKRLPTGEEWLVAAQGTDDPLTGNPGSMNARCNTQDDGARPTGAGSSCRSAWGAQDMVGNVWEWTAEWYAGAGDALSLEGRAAITINIPMGTPPSVTIPARPAIQPGFTNMGRAVDNWTIDYGHDGVWNVAGWTNRGDTGAPGLPAAAMRGGYWGDRVQAGIFALNLHAAPSLGAVFNGFRCVIPR